MNSIAQARCLLAAVTCPRRRQDLRERFTERAGICQHDSRMPRDKAEAMALRELMSEVAQE